MSASYALITELSRNEKLQKYRIILSQHTNYLHKWLVHMFTAAMFIFFPPRFLNMCKPWTTFYLLWRTGPPWFAFYGSGLALGWLSSMRSEIFLRMKSIIFQGCPTKQATFFIEIALRCGCSLVNIFRTYFL